MIGPILTVLSPLLNTIIESVFPDKEKQAEAKAKLLTITLEAQKTEMEQKGNIIVAEANGESAAQRNWRPHLMYTFMFIFIFNFIFAPIMGIFGIIVPTLPIPPNMWTLLTVGLGGYIGSRGYEKVTRMKQETKLAEFNHKAFYDTTRSEYGNINQKDVDRLNKSIKAGLGQ